MAFSLKTLPGWVQRKRQKGLRGARGELFKVSDTKTCKLNICSQWNSISWRHTRTMSAKWQKSFSPLLSEKTLNWKFLQSKIFQYYMSGWHVMLTPFRPSRLMNFLPRCNCLSRRKINTKNSSLDSLFFHPRANNEFNNKVSCRAPTFFSDISDSYVLFQGWGEKSNAELPDQTERTGMFNMKPLNSVLS